MRMLFILILTLTACTSPRVRCDRHLQRINPPAATARAGTAAGAAVSGETP